MIEKALKLYQNAPIHRHLLLNLLKTYKRPNDKISEMLKNKELIALKRGLYVPGEKMDLKRPSLFSIANHLYGPSYVSLTSALSYWGLIPEKVVEISSVTTKPSKVFRNELGRFRYQKLSLPYYSQGIKQVQINEQQTVLMASAEKAICDLIILTPGVNLRSRKQTIAFLVEDLRIQEEELFLLNTKEIAHWLTSAHKASSIKTLVNTLESL